MPPIIVSFLISTVVGLLFLMLWNTQSAFFGSTIINLGIFFDKLAKPAIIAAAIPPTPACKKT